MLSLETVAPKAGKIPFRVRYEILRRELRAADGGVEKKLDPQTEQSFLLPNRLVPVGEQTAVLATDWPRPEDSLARARAIYEGVLQHMRYDKSRPGYGRGDARWACRSGFGNCTDFHSLFIAIARDREIPAKFEIGFPLPPGSTRERSEAITAGRVFMWMAGAGFPLISPKRTSTRSCGSIILEI